MKIEIWEREDLREIQSQWKRIRVLAFNVFQEEMSDVHLTRESSAVLYLIVHTDLTQKQIAKKLSISEATLSVRMKKLEKDGYLKRVVDPADRRKYKLEATPLGIENIDMAISRLNKIHHHMLKGITQEDTAHMMHILGVIENNLEEMKGEQDA